MWLSGSCYLTPATPATPVQGGKAPVTQFWPTRVSQFSPQPRLATDGRRQLATPINLPCQLLNRFGQRAPVRWSGTEPFRSRANSLPGANRPIGPWPIRSLELSLSGTFAPWPFRSLAFSLPGPFVPRPIRSRERKFYGTFVPWNFRSLELSLP